MKKLIKCLIFRIKLQATKHPSAMLDRTIGNFQTLIKNKAKLSNDESAKLNDLVSSLEVDERIGDHIDRPSIYAELEDFSDNLLSKYVPTNGDESGFMSQKPKNMFQNWKNYVKIEAILQLMGALIGVAIDIMGSFTLLSIWKGVYYSLCILVAIIAIVAFVFDKKDPSNDKGSEIVATKKSNSQITFLFCAVVLSLGSPLILLLLGKEFSTVVQLSILLLSAVGLIAISIISNAKKSKKTVQSIKIKSNTTNSNNTNSNNTTKNSSGNLNIGSGTQNNTAGKNVNNGSGVQINIEFGVWCFFVLIAIAALLLLYIMPLDFTTTPKDPDPKPIVTYTMTIDPNGGTFFGDDGGRPFGNGMQYTISDGHFSKIEVVIYKNGYSLKGLFLDTKDGSTMIYSKDLVPTQSVYPYDYDIVIIAHWD